MSITILKTRIILFTSNPSSTYSINSPTSKMLAAHHHLAHRDTTRRGGGNTKPWMSQTCVLQILYHFFDENELYTHVQNMQCFLFPIPFWWFLNVGSGTKICIPMCNGFEQPTLTIGGISMQEVVVCCYVIIYLTSTTQSSKNIFVHLKNDGKRMERKQDSFETFFKNKIWNGKCQIGS